MNDLLLPIYLFVVYLAIACWLRTPVKVTAAKPKTKTSATIKAILLPPQIRDPIVLDLVEPETLEPKPQRSKRTKRTLKDVIEIAVAA